MQAEQCARHAIECGLTSPVPWLLLARCLYARQAPAREVHEAFVRGLVGEELTVDLAIQAGFAALVAEQYESADTLARQAETLQPTWSVPRHLRALAARASGASAERIAELMRHAMRGEDTSAELAYDAAAAAFDLGEFVEADRYIDLAVAARPEWDDACGLQLAIHAGLPADGIGT